MLSFIHGKILNKGNGYVIVETSGLGYKIFVTSKNYTELDIKQEVELYLHQHIKEDASDLYGFNSLAELDFFELLISVSGVGPKSALNILILASIEEIKNAIAFGDSDLLTKVSGIGKKTAERIVLELKTKVGALAQTDINSSYSSKNDEIDALISLGYSLSQAREALNKIDKTVSDSGERIKLALKNLAN